MAEGVGRNLAVTPIERIREEYSLHPREQPFEYYLNWHLQHGFVFSTPDYFIMGRAIFRANTEAETLDLINSLVFVEEIDAEAWYVHAMAGDMSKAWEILPWPLPYIAFERLRGDRMELTVLHLERMKRLSHAVPKQTVA